MTAQEAKQRLERIWKSYGEAYEIYDEDVTAFDMATNSLGAIEQIQWERDMAIKQLHDLGYGLGEKPREDNSSSDKLIKASDAVDVVAKHSALYGNGEISTDEGETLLYDIMSEITNLPSAQPERKTGEWIDGEESEGACNIVYTEHICSECGYSYSFPLKYNFCPECGADMRGDSDEQQ